MTHRLEGMGQAAKYGGLTVLNAKGDRHFNGVVRTHDDALTIPLKWKKPKRIFVNSMSDLFHRDVPLAFIDMVFAVMSFCPQHTFQLLTKRPERMAEYLKASDLAQRWIDAAYAIDLETSREAEPAECCDVLPLPNVWLGTSVENQPAADERIPHLLRCPAAVRFLSCEPLLSAVDLTSIPCGSIYYADSGESKPIVFDALQISPDSLDPSEQRYGSGGVDWVIVGGESGPGARPCDVGWIRSILAQCKAAGVPAFVKQLGAVAVEENAGDDFNYVDSGGTIRVPLKNKKGGDIGEWPDDLRVRDFPCADRSVPHAG